jgi:hypothetical protein
VTKRHGLAALCIEPLFEFAPIGTGICAASQDGANIHHGKPPFLVVPDTANGGFLEYRDVVRGIVGGCDFFHMAPRKAVILYSILQLRQSLFLNSAMTSAA